MADRFPLIVNSVSQKIEELVSGDNLDLSGNNIVISGDTGSGKYLTSNGTVVSWGSPGDVYLNASQTLTNKTFDSCVISGSVNTLSINWKTGSQGVSLGTSVELAVGFFNGSHFSFIETVKG